MFLTMAEIKAQVRQELDNPTHDDELTRLALAAERWAANWLNVASLEVLAADTSPPASPVAIPEDVKSALLLHIDAHFARDDMMDGMVEAARNLLWPYRQGLGV